MHPAGVCVCGGGQQVWCPHHACLCRCHQGSEEAAIVGSAHMEEGNF